MGAEARQEILLTGATGFLGKVVLDELLRRAPAARIWILVRPTDRESVLERVQRQVAGAACFQGLPLERWRRVRPLRGDLTLPDCGLSPATVGMLRTRLTHLVHCAASVDFDLPLAAATQANVTGALRALQLARECRRLRAMVAVSTAYVGPHPPRGELLEELAALPFDAADSYAAILEGVVSQRELLKDSGHPNTYTFTKCLAEHLLFQRRGRVPLRIVRPSIISASLRWPQPGWIDSFAAFAGFVVLIGAGRLRVLRAEPDNPLDIVPCDAVAQRVVDCTLAPAPHGGASLHYAVAGLDRCCTVRQCCDGIVRFFSERRIDRQPGLAWIGSDRARFHVENLQHHVAPLALAHTWLGLAGKGRQRKDVARLIQRVDYLNTAFPYFTHRAFDFQARAPLSMPGFRAEAYLRQVCRGVYRYLLKRADA